MRDTRRRTIADSLFPPGRPTPSPAAGPGAEARRSLDPPPFGSRQRRAPVFSRLRRIISRVPKGKVITYGQVAAAGGFPRAPRLTVWALRSSHDLPWHRVVAAGGRIALSGAAGEEQRLRLRLEGVTFRGEEVRMERHNWTPRGRSGNSSGRRGNGLVGI
ncbi:MAG: MGMT family protein [Thermoplasmata archaeon]